MRPPLLDPTRGPPASPTEAPADQLPPKIKKVKPMLPPPPGYPYKWLCSLRLSECKRIIRSRVHRYLRRRFFYFTKRGIEQPTWQVFYQKDEIKSFKPPVDSVPRCILVTSAVVIGNQHFRVTSGGIQLRNGRLMFTIGSTDSLSDLKVQGYPIAGIDIPFESLREIILTDVNECDGAYALMFMISNKVYSFIESAGKVALAGRGLFESTPNSEGNHALIFEMPNNYHADDYNLIHFSAHVAYTRELMGKAGLDYIEKEAAYFDNILKLADVHLLKIHNLLNNPIYIIKTIPIEPLPPVKLFDDYEPEPKDYVSIDLPGQRIRINETDLTDLMGYCTLRKKVVDFYIDYIVSKLKPADQVRIAVVSTADLVNLTRPCTDRDDFFEKEIVIIPFFYKNSVLPVILTHPGALFENAFPRDRVPTAVIMWIRLSPLAQARIIDVIISYVQFQFERLKAEGWYYSYQNCDAKKLTPRFIRLAARKGFKPTGVYLLQLLERVFNHLPEPGNDLHLSDGPTDADYMTPYAFRHAIRHAITNRVRGKQPELKKEPYQFPVANYNEEAAKKRSQDAIAFWDFFIKKKDAADANVA
uniref:Lactamase_B domain-containing protein n=1 Tax=Panagrellus redivivus TaxID=6233 RepID=A0A7E4VVG6_PANRE